MRFRPNLMIRFLYVLVIALTSQGVFANSQCPREVLPAYTGDLDVESKYDPRDPSRSTSTEVDSRSKAIRDYLNRFSSELGLFSDYYVSNRTKPQRALAVSCMHEWIGHWANAEAITTDNASPTGRALRSWTLSAVSSAIWKLSLFAEQEWALTAKEEAWISRLADMVRTDYEYRLSSKPERINNHDYWAAWAVGASGMVTGKTDNLSWSYTIFQFAMSQAEADAVTGTAYLPNELGRGRLGAHYTQFALTPLVMLADWLPSFGYTVNYQDQVRLRKLADFAAIVVMAPDRVAHLLTESQRTPSVSSFFWLIPFNARHQDILSTQRLESIVQPYLTTNYRLGGDIRPMYQ